MSKITIFIFYLQTYFSFHFLDFLWDHHPSSYPRQKPISNLSHSHSPNPIRNLINSHSKCFVAPSHISTVKSRPQGVLEAALIDQINQVGSYLILPLQFPVKVTSNVLFSSISLPVSNGKCIGNLIGLSYISLQRLYHFAFPPTKFENAYFLASLPGNICCQAFGFLTIDI